MSTAQKQSVAPFTCLGLAKRKGGKKNASSNEPISVVARRPGRLRAGVSGGVAALVSEPAGGNAACSSTAGESLAGASVGSEAAGIEPGPDSGGEARWAMDRLAGGRGGSSGGVGESMRRGVWCETVGIGRDEPADAEQPRQAATALRRAILDARALDRARLLIWPRSRPTCMGMQTGHWRKDYAISTRSFSSWRSARSVPKTCRALLSVS